MLGLQPVTMPAHVLGFMVCYLLPIVAVMLYEGWLLRQFAANQRLRAGSSRATRASAAAQKAAAVVQEADRLPAPPGQHASSSMGNGSGNEGLKASTTSNTGGYQQGGLVRTVRDDLRAGNFGGSVIGGGGSVRSSSATAETASGQAAAGRQFVYKRPKGCLQRITVAVKVMHAFIGRKRCYFGQACFRASPRSTNLQNTACMVNTCIQVWWTYLYPMRMTYRYGVTV